MAEQARVKAEWQMPLTAGFFAQAVTGIGLEQVVEAADAITRDQVVGRPLVKL
ncbi:hypothetical protein [Aeromonas rivipollensis]|uniref:hypothetical protein n=1 Tax=Aeromonas rivipollensis TaxID=948519 RepID=UPI0038EBF946